MKRRHDTPLPDEWFECQRCKQLENQINRLKKQIRSRPGLYETADEYAERIAGEGD